MKAHCPHCDSELLWSEDRGVHCDGCDDFDAEPNPPKDPMNDHTAEPSTFRVLAIIVVVFAIFYFLLMHFFQLPEKQKEFPVQKKSLTISPSR